MVNPPTRPGKPSRASRPKVLRGQLVTSHAKQPRGYGCLWNLPPSLKRATGTWPEFARANTSSLDALLFLQITAFRWRLCILSHFCLAMSGVLWRSDFRIHLAAFLISCIFSARFIFRASLHLYITHGENSIYLYEYDIELLEPSSLWLITNSILGRWPPRSPRVYLGKIQKLKRKIVT